MSTQSKDLESALLELFDSHPSVKDLKEQTKDACKERSILAIPADDVADNFTTGTLATRVGFAVSPVMLVSLEAKTVIAAYYLGKGFTGHKGYVHGGVIATIMDECCGRAGVCYFEAQKSDTNSEGTYRSAAVTAQLSVTYAAPIKTESMIVVKAAVAESESKGRKAVTVAQLWSPSTSEGSEQTLCAEARGIFIEPKGSHGGE